MLERLESHALFVKMNIANCADRQKLCMTFLVTIMSPKEKSVFLQMIDNRQESHFSYMQNHSISPTTMKTYKTLELE